METPTILARIVRLPGHPGNDTSAQAIRAEDGCLPVGLPLSASGFAPGDLIEIRLVRRDGERGCRPKLPDQFGRPYGLPIPMTLSCSFCGGPFLSSATPEAVREIFGRLVCDGCQKIAQPKP